MVCPPFRLPEIYEEPAGLHTIQKNVIFFRYFLTAAKPSGNI